MQDSCSASAMTVAELISSLSKLPVERRLRSRSVDRHYGVSIRAAEARLAVTSSIPSFSLDGSIMVDGPGQINLATVTFVLRELRPSRSRLIRLRAR